MAINRTLWDLMVLTSIICKFLCYKAILKLVYYRLNCGHPANNLAQPLDGVSSMRNMSFSTPSCNSSTTTPCMMMSLMATLSLHLIFVHTVGWSTTHKLNVLSCIDISMVHCSGGLVLERKSASHVATRVEDEELVARQAR